MTFGVGTYTFEISMNHPPMMDVDQSPSNISQLYPMTSANLKRSDILNEKPTRPSRSAPGFPFRNLLMSPFTIQSDIIAKWCSDIATPTSCRTLGCCRDFHVITSLQNLYMGIITGCQVRRERGKTNNSRRPPSAILPPNIALKLSQRHPVHNVSLSTRPQTRLYITGSWCCHSKWES